MPTDADGSASAVASASFGPNAWLVEDLYEQYLADPASVSEGWRDFFVGFKPASSPPPPVAAPTPAVPAAVAPRTTETGVEPLRGAAARIVANMTASLGIPTATSVRTVPARLLEINRSLLNGALGPARGTKVSFTHLIAFAIVRGLTAFPALNANFVEPSDNGGVPGVRRHTRVGLGLAVDLEKKDGTRTLMVPVIGDADTLDFRSFLLAYEEKIRKVHSGAATADDFVGATVSLTNPGTLGTVQSVPRLMAGLGAIFGVGALGFPAGYEATDPRTLAELGVGKVLTLTSTYDHRIIQGAESGLFLKHVGECLTGSHNFYDDVFSSLGVHEVPARWSADRTEPEGGDVHERALKQVRVQELVNMYRVRGHLNADLDPLRLASVTTHPELDLAHYGLTIWDLPRRFAVDGLAGRYAATLEEILAVLRDAYCRSVGLEFMHIMDPEQKRWIQERVEGVDATPSRDQQRRVLDQLIAAEVFERFLHTRYVGQKRFGLEGAESTIVVLDEVLSAAAADGVTEAVIGMAHRGRLNVLANVVGKSYSDIFSEFEGNLDPESVQGSGDVKYHKGASGAFRTASGATIAVSMASNPSHLEAVDPVVEGIVRAKQDRVLPPSDGTADAPVPERYPFLPILIHGDAAFAGQGVVAETLNLSQLSGYHVGGTIHLIVNNQLGFTTSPDAARSSLYPTDVAKMIQAPIFHVNGDDPEACARVAALAFSFRQRFKKDAVIDLVCYRRYGHNEGDDPSYTQPLMYKVIDQARSVRYHYTETLVRRGDLTLEEATATLDAFNARLQGVLDEVRTVPKPELHAVPTSETPPDPDAPATGVSAETLAAVAEAVMTPPAGFTLHPKLVRQFAQRRELLAAGEVDWALGEALALGTLVLEGTDVRLTGQDTRRGTFSQRHGCLVDYETGAEYVPLSHLPGARGFCTLRDSLLSEYAALGFEYGYSVESPLALVCWEAQFGDFVNGAEIIVDNFLVAAEDKWGQNASLTLLLPHGYEGQGPEHSSARVERFLSLCARNNLRVAQPSSAAQYFHLLRAQVRRDRVTPLVVLTPKSLLRAPSVRSPRDAFTSGQFAPVLDDPAAPPASVTRVVLAAGKVALEALEHREAASAHHVAVLRLEQFYPWPEADLAAALARYSGATEFVWLQEEPENMGAWSFVHQRVHRTLAERFKVRHVSRAPSASPATGSTLVHAAEQADLLVRALS